MTFDYITAWEELARPQFEALPANVRALLDRVTAEAGHLSQLADCSMPWPDETSEASIAAFDGVTLRQKFDKIPAEFLAKAAHVVYFVGHWGDAQSRAELIPAGSATWKFSHYADQVLRERLGLPPRGDNGRDKSRIQYAVHEGLIRVAYSSPDMWSWKEVAPATAEGYKAAQAIAADLRSIIEAARQPNAPRKTIEAQDSAAYEFLQKLETTSPLKSWPGWEMWADISKRYQCSEHEFQRRRAAERPPVDRVALVAKMRADHDAAIGKHIKNESIELEGKIWLIERGLPIDNAIYYTHTGRWCFGWRQELTPEDRSALLDVLSEFPYEYDLKGGKQERCMKCGDVRLHGKPRYAADKCSPRCDWVTL